MPPTSAYTLSLHDALPISPKSRLSGLYFGLCNVTINSGFLACECCFFQHSQAKNPELIVTLQDRKSTRLNSSHRRISYAVFCVKKQNSISRLRRAQDIEVV